MIIEIDQSGKIESTNRLTVVAYSNGAARSIKISAVEKQKLIKIMRTISHPKKSYIYKIFATLIFILLDHSDKVSEVIIDKEYPGKDATIKNFIIQLYGKKKKKNPEIWFDNIGKKSQAHIVAHEVFQNKRKADIIVKSTDVLGLLYPK